MSKKTSGTQTLKITPAQRERLREIALEHGLKIGRGREMHWGSITKLAEAIADGQLVVVRPPSTTAP